LLISIVLSKTYAANSPVSNAMNPPLLKREGLRVRSTEKAIDMMKLTKRQIEVTMFAAGVGTLEDLKIGKLLEQ